MRASHRLINNVLINYLRVLITIILGLYSTRIILEALGAADFGLYSMIAGLVATLAFLNAVMSTSTQRFISVSLGKCDLNETKKIFVNSLILHFLIGVIILFFIEVIGVYLIKNKLVIPKERIDDAMYLLHFVSISTFFTIISVPYDALVTAHEDMAFLAIVNIIESILKVGVAVSLLYLASQKLIMYGFLLMIITVILVLVKRTYCKYKYKNCIGNIKIDYDNKLMIKVGSFASWQLFGSLSAIARNQGTAVVLNLFFSTIVNAAYGIANQVNGQLMFFTQAILTAIRPQIMKSEGASDRERMIKLALLANKFAFYFFSIIAIPAYLLLPTLLSWWLKEVPQYTIDFCRAIIILTLVSQLSQGVIVAVQAIGKIKIYQIVAGGILLLTIPIGYLFLSNGFEPVIVIYVSVVLEILTIIFRAFYFRHLTSYPIYQYFSNILLRTIIVTLISTLLLFFVNDLSDNRILNVINVSLTSLFVFVPLIYFIGLNRSEKQFLTNGISGFIVFFKNKNFK